MKLLLIQNKIIRDFSTIYDFKDNVVEFEDTKFAQTERYKFDYLQDADPQIENIVEFIESKFTDIDGIVIGNLLESETEHATHIEKSAFQIATHIRLSKTAIKYLPILILSELSIEDLVLVGTRKVHILQCLYGIKIRPLTIKSIMIEEGENDTLPFEEEIGENIFYFLKEFGATAKREIESKFNNVDNTKIKVESSGISSHEISNEWGAYQMAKTAGLDLSKFYFPKTLYFKYLTSSIDEKGNDENTTYCKPFWDKDLKILFVDDYCKKGWSDCLQSAIEKTMLIEPTKRCEIISSPKWEDNLLEPIKKAEYELILLDYYLGKEKGIDILKKIKEVNPIIPVVMFTASNKAWNMNELYEAGADGYYIKEHPETASDPEFSKKNFENFHNTVEGCLNKGALLKKYWLKIQAIKDSAFIENKGDQKNKERIEERLMMFLGLLKRAFQQTEFDKKTFFYSEWELAFLTLWSTLNELSQVHYIKHCSFIPFSLINSDDNEEQLVNSHPNGSIYNNEKFMNWQIRDTESYLVAYRPEFDYHNQPIRYNENLFKLRPYSKMVYNDNDFNFYAEYQATDTRHPYSRLLFIQIAFLLNNLKINNSADYIDILLTNLLRINTNRNKLYLTHGEEFRSVESFKRLYADQRKDTEYWKKEIRELFEIVFLLSAGIECEW